MDGWLRALQAGGFRNTAPCRAVLEVLGDADRALTPSDIRTAGRHRTPSLGLATVYRTLEKLEKLGIVERVHQPGGCSLYLRATQGHEHLLVCTGCLRVERFRGDNLAPLERVLARRSGYSIQHHWLQFHGLCGECKKTSAKKG